MPETPYILTFLAQVAPGSGMNWLIPLLLIAGMWFLIIAPQRKMQKEHDKMVAELKPGDEILTKGGVYGTVVNVKKDRFVVKIADNAKIELSKPFVQQVVKAKGEPAKEDEEKKEDLKKAEPKK